MSRLIIVADIHGKYSSWKKIISTLKKDDELAVAGDLFGTKYLDEVSIQEAELILNEFENLPNKKHFVYGNCDDPAFSPGFEYQKTFTFDEQKILLHHGHIPHTLNSKINIVISGHTHCKMKEIKNNITYFNPGSLSRPRDGSCSYGILENKILNFINLKDT